MGSAIRGNAAEAAFSGCVVFNAYSTDHGSGPRSYAGLADLFGVYFPPSDEVFLAPIDAVGAKGRFRLEPPRNNQRKRIRLAAEFEISTWTDQRLAHVAAAVHATAT